MIKLNNVSKIYGDFYALEKISLIISKGEFIAITGRSGSGKTTLMNMIGGLDKPSKGIVTVNDLNINLFKDKDLASYLNTEIGFIFQNFNLENTYTVFQNIELPLLVAGLSKRERKNRILFLCDRLGLNNQIDKKAKNLSGGEKQRVAIARAIANNPKIILADEPCGNLDSYNSENILTILDEINKEGITIVLVTHQLSDIKPHFRRIKMKDGKIEDD